MSTDTKESILESNLLKTLKDITLNEFNHKTVTFRKLPGCMRLNDDKYIIGKYVVSRHNNIWEVADTINIIYFSDYKYAMYYCVFAQTNKADDANEIAKLNTKFLSLSQDEYFFKRKLAMTKKDVWKQDLYSARYTQTVAMLFDVSNKLNKKINLAKYKELRDFKL